MDTPYKQYLRTNYTPRSRNEAKDIQRVIDETAQGIVAIDAQIGVLRSQMYSLLEKRYTIHDFGEQHRALLSPVRRLTPDILEEIFLACLPSDRNPCMSASEAPILLTRICSSWRQIAFSAPRLWAAIHIVLPNVQLDPYPSQGEIIIRKELVCRALKRREIAVSEWLGRSGVCPLSISMYEVAAWIGELNDANVRTIKDLQNEHLTFIVNTIIPYHQQWHELDICISEEILDGIIDIGLKAESLIALKALHVTRINNFSDTRTTKHHWKDALALLPTHASAVTFMDFPVRSSDLLSIPLYAWSGLTELNLSMFNDQFGDMPINSVNLMAEILCHCHSLVTLTLLLEFFEPGEDSRRAASSDKILLPRLSKLNIALPPSPEVLPFAKRLYLPSLTEITVQISQFSRTLEVSSKILLALLSAGGIIHTLTLCSPLRWMSSYNDLVQILKAAPGITHLKISSVGIYRKWTPSINATTPLARTHVRDIVTDSLLQDLSPLGVVESDIMCPMLQEFVCSPDLITGITESGLKKFLKARQRDHRVANIRRISVFINEPKIRSVNGEDLISLEADSAVFFKKVKLFSISPFEGYRFERKIGSATGILTEAFTEI